MKKYIAFFIVYMTVGMLACEDSGENEVLPPAELMVLKSVGEQIPFETGIRWIEDYQKGSKDGGRSAIFGNYSVSDAQVLAMMQSVTGFTGFAFHYGTDILGVRHILVIPIDESLSVWDDIPGRILVDANSGNTISLSTAQSWAQRYKNANPNDVWFHFFGSDIFDEIVGLPFFNTLDIEPGIDLLNLTPEMLLIVWIDAGGLFGRTADDEGIIYDASNPCPPCGIE